MTTTGPPAPELRLDGLRAVVTGASSGIGAGIARAFAAAGARVGIGCHRSRGAADALAHELGDGHVVLAADLATPDGCRAIVDDAWAQLGGVEVWVNNAGADVLTGEAAQWSAERKLDALLELDLRATIRCCRQLAERMAPGGAILNMGWDRATVNGMAGDDAEILAAVKAAVLGYSKSLARSVAPGLRVNVLCPGWVETAFGQGADRDFYDQIVAETPLARWGRPQDVGGVAVWLASPAAAYVTGQAINIDGGTLG